MAAVKVLAFLRKDQAGVLAVVGPPGCGKRHTVAEAARQVGVAVTQHDLAQGTIEWSRLGRQQLTSTGLAGCVHVISNASEQFLKDFASSSEHMWLEFGEVLGAPSGCGSCLVRFGRPAEAANLVDLADLSAVKSAHGCPSLRTRTRAVSLSSKTSWTSRLPGLPRLPGFADILEARFEARDA